MTPLFIGGIGMQEVLLIALVVLLFFGGKKIPELMKGIGKGVRSALRHSFSKRNYLPLCLLQRMTDSLPIGCSTAWRHGSEVR